MPQTRPTEPPADAKLLTYWEAAWLLRCGKDKVREFAETGVLDARKTGYRTVTITRQSVQKLIDQGGPLRRYRFRAAS